MKYNFCRVEQIITALVSRREQSHEYVDTGCKGAKELYNYQGQCVDCPLPICLEDTRMTPKSILDRRCKIVELRQQGLQYREIATRLGICKDTVCRYLRKERRNAAIQ